MNDKLYLNLTNGINNAFIRSAKRSIKQGDGYWVSLREKIQQRPKGKYWADGKD